MTLMLRALCNSLLWNSAPTSLNNDLLNDGVFLEKYSDTINLAIGGSCIVPLWRWLLEVTTFDVDIYARLGGGTRHGHERMESWRKT